MLIMPREHPMRHRIPCCASPEGCCLMAKSPRYLHRAQPGLSQSRLCMSLLLVLLLLLLQLLVLTLSANLPGGLPPILPLFRSCLFLAEWAQMAKPALRTTSATVLVHEGTRLALALRMICGAQAGKAAVRNLSGDACTRRLQIASRLRGFGKLRHRWCHGRRQWRGGGFHLGLLRAPCRRVEQAQGGGGRISRRDGGAGGLGLRRQGLDKLLEAGRRQEASVFRQEAPGHLGALEERALELQEHARDAHIFTTALPELCKPSWRAHRRIH
mmetsp:Transcript_165324/g.530658  ORF Transcript_165324/g.530658 Transcript_165324/m.530658 type:complete len:271 (-) Transcript_165324:297-1109(-)